MKQRAELGQDQGRGKALKEEWRTVWPEIIGQVSRCTESVFKVAVWGTLFLRVITHRNPIFCNRIVFAVFGCDSRFIPVGKLNYYRVAYMIYDSCFHDVLSSDLTLQSMSIIGSHEYYNLFVSLLELYILKGYIKGNVLPWTQGRWSSKPKCPAWPISKEYFANMLSVYKRTTYSFFVLICSILSLSSRVG